MKALKVTVDWAEMDLFAATLKELNDDENIFAYQIDTLTGIVVCENECGLLIAVPVLITGLPQL